MTDKSRVCAQCALFGQHKGHDIRQEEDVVKEVALKVDVLMDMYANMETQQGELASDPNYDKYYNMFKGR